MLSGVPTAAGDWHVVEVAITDGDGATSTRTYSLEVVHATPSVGLTSSSPSAATGASVTFKATVSPNGATADPQSFVDFFDGEPLLGRAPIVGGVATLTTSALPAGPRAIRAGYSGDDVFGPAASATVEQSVRETVTGSIVPPATPPSFGARPSSR